MLWRPLPLVMRRGTAITPKSRLPLRLKTLSLRERSLRLRSARSIAIERALFCIYCGLIRRRPYIFRKSGALSISVHRIFYPGLL